MGCPCPRGLSGVFLQEGWTDEYEKAIPPMKPLLAAVFRPRSLELWDGTYSRSRLWTDIGAGITVGLIALPLSLALGVASIPVGAATPFPAPAAGLFTAIIAGFVVSLLGGSRVQIAGPTAAFMPIVVLIVERYGFDGLLLATMMAGVILVAMGLARLGGLIKYIPYPVTSGFTTGIAISIALSQAADFLGISAATPAPREFPAKSCGSAEICLTPTPGAGTGRGLRTPDLFLAQNRLEAPSGNDRRPGRRHRRRHPLGWPMPTASRRSARASAPRRSHPICRRSPSLPFRSNASAA